MKLYKNDTITVRVNPILKAKFEVAIWFLWVSDSISYYMQNIIRDFEKQYWIIPTWADKNTQYDIITKMFWVKLSKKRFEELLESYPKTKKNIAMYWD